MEDEDMDAVLEKKSCDSKTSRRVCEKLRRDRLNSLILQLGEEIPIIKNAHRRLDKLAILRLTVSYMKLHLGLKRKKLGNKASLHEAGLLDWLKKISDDALFIVTQSGMILYVSPNITVMVGFYQSDMVGYNIKQFVHPDDLDLLMSRFLSQENPTVKSKFQSSASNLAANIQALQTGNDLFYIRLLKAVSRNYVTDERREYEMMSVRANCEHRLGVEYSSVGELWVLAMFKPFGSEPIKEMQLKISEFMKNNEYATMHDLDGKIIASDQRASLFHGYMSSEVVGRTPYIFINDNDLESVALSHQIIMKDHETPSTVFRLNSKFGMAVYVQSRSIIVNHEWTKKPKCIVSVNTVLFLEEGIRLLALQKRRTRAFKNSLVLNISEENDEVRTPEPRSDGNDEVRTPEPRSDDSTDSDERHNPAYREHRFTHCITTATSVLEIQKRTGESLSEIYDKICRSYPELYVSDDNCSSTESVPAQKRSYDCVDGEFSVDGESSVHSESSGPESASFINLLCDASNIGVTRNEIDSSKHISPSLMRDENLLDKAGTYIKAAAYSATEQESSPLLKSLLLGEVKMDCGKCVPVESGSLIVEPAPWSTSLSVTNENGVQCFSVDSPEFDSGCCNIVSSPEL